MGRVLTPGERAINWAKALGVLCAALVSLLGYQNREVIASWIPGKGKVSDPVHSAIDELIIENELRFAEIQELKKALQKNNGPLWVELKKQNQRIERWHGSE